MDRPSTHYRPCLAHFAPYGRCIAPKQLNLLTPSHGRCARNHQLGHSTQIRASDVNR